ncbi:hypothetical protein AB4865_01755 [Capnocytophaga sp. ARDL2]|uniref:hypothetical protein n=1 Tax=Capnocytophaga sp. ARDL2 TaxID=3238809 RepID=UPI003557DAEB
MQKWITHFLIVLFVGFLSTPTAFAMTDKEIENYILAEEEEESHNSKNGEINENEVFADFSKSVKPLFSAEQIFHLHTTTHTLSDDLVVRIPSPPPEFS